MIYCINICANVQEPFQLQCTVPSFPVIFSMDCMQYVHIWGAFLLLFACCWCGHHSMLYLPIKSLLSFRCWNWRNLNLQRWFYLFIVISLILLLSTKIMVIFFPLPLQVVFYCHFPDMLLAQHTTVLRRIYRKPIDFLEEMTTGLFLDIAFVFLA